MSVNKIYNIQEWQRVLTTATPSSGNEIIYPKTDGNWYHKGSDGVEKILSLSYNIGNGLTTSATSSLYNYILSVNIDGVSLTSSNIGVLSVGSLTASSLSLTTATAGYILSVDNIGNPVWIYNSNIGSYGVNNFVPKYTGVSSLTNSNIYDSGTSINIFTTSNSVVSDAKLFVNGAIDVSAIYFTSSVFTYITSNSQKITAKSSGFNISDSSLTYLDSNKDSTNGNNFNILNSLVQITATGSANLTASIIAPNINLVGLGTASPTHLLHLYSTSAAFRLVDGSQGPGKILSSDAYGVASWVSPSTLSFSFSSNSGLTNSNGFAIVLAPNSGLTISNSGLFINPNIAGSGLTFSGGSMSILSVPASINTGKGLTTSGTTYLVDILTNGGLTFSGNQLSISSTLAGSGLAYSGGSMSVIASSTTITGTTNSLPYFNTTNSLTASVISQISNEILIGTTSNIGALLYVAGSFSFTNDGIINGINIGRGNNATNILIGNNALSALSPGNTNIAIGDNALALNQQNNNIAIGNNALTNNTSGLDNIAIGVSAMNSNATGAYNVAIGDGTLVSTTNGSYNVAIGVYAGFSAVLNSVAIGANSGKVGSYNISVGYNAGNSNNLGNYNVLLGYSAGQSFNGTGSVIIGGFDTTGVYSSLSNTLNTLFISDGYGNLRIYSPSTGNILFGTVSDNGSLLQVAGSMSIISTTSKAFQLKDTTQSIGRVLTSDANGYGTWQSLTASGVVYKYAATQSFTASVPSIITHNLNTMFYTIQLFDYPTGEEIMGGYTNRGLTQATITLSMNVPNCGIVIIG